MCNFSILKLVCLHFCCGYFLDNAVPLYVSMPRRLNLRKTMAECLLEAIFLENCKSKGTLGIRHQKQSFKGEKNINFFQQLCMKEMGIILSRHGIKIMYSRLRVHFIKLKFLIINQHIYIQETPCLIWECNSTLPLKKKFLQNKKVVPITPWCVLPMSQTRKSKYRDG